MRSFYEFLADVAEQCGHEYYLPHMHTDPEANAEISGLDVFRKDREELRRADIVIAYIGRPSLGVGAEIGISICEGTRVIALYNTNAQVSRFLLGMLRDSDAQVFSFADAAECRRLLTNALDSVHSRTSC